MSVHAEHFENAEHQHITAELGMWVFLATELMFFGPLFLGYSMLRFEYPEGVAAASHHTNAVIGTINTAILLTSSLCMALSVRAAQLAEAKLVRKLLSITAALGVAFLVLKGVEYYQEWDEHLVPWLDFRFNEIYRGPAALFYWFYFGMTGLHAVHLTIGVVLMIALACRVDRRNISSLSNMIEMSGLYWHFVDAVWVFLFPILYLVERYR